MGGKFRRLRVALGFVALPLTACDDAFGPDMGSVEVTMVQSGSIAAFQIAVANVLPAAGVDINAVESLTLTITGVDLLPQGGEEGGPWVALSVNGETGAQLDLLATPAEGTSLGIELARGELTAGSYGNIRIRFTDAVIVFKEDVQVGPALFEAATEYELFVPSGAQSGIKTDMSLDLEGGEAETVQLVFEGAASTATIHATGNGKVIMAPVLRAETEAETTAG